MDLTIDDVEQVAAAFWSLGGESVDLGIARGCRRPDVGPTTPECFLRTVRPTSPDELAALLDAAAPWCRRVVIDENTPRWVSARLVAADWTLTHQLQLVLPAGAEVGAPAAPSMPLRPVAERDWPTIRAMLRVDHAEEDARAGSPTRPVARTDDALSVRRALAAHADYRVAADTDDGAAGFVCGWADGRGVGIVEDVFVDPGHRRRGVASALVAAAVACARARGAGPVVIASDPLDHPKHLYQRLGFVPFTVTRTAVAPVASGE